MEPNVVSNERKWDLRFLELAGLVAHWSKDPSTKCGAVIVRPDRTVASVGFNGFPKGTLDYPDFYFNRELKLARVIHAEVNAILHASESVKGYTMYTYQSPMIGHACDRCAAHVIQAGIARIITYDCLIPTRYVDSIQRGLDMFKEACIDVVVVGEHVGS